MSCTCGASFQTDSENNDTLAMLWANKFVAAHVDCGYMSKSNEVESEEKMKRYDIIYKEPREKEL